MNWGMALGLAMIGGVFGGFIAGRVQAWTQIFYRSMLIRRREYAGGDVSADTDTDTAARQRIAGVTATVMQKAAESLNAMVNQIIENVRQDEKFLGAILTPGVNLELDLQVPDALEHKIMVLIAECVALDRLETIEQIADMIGHGEVGADRMMEALKTAQAEAADITKAADGVRAAKAPKANKSAAAQGPGVVLPDGLVRCKNCGGAAAPLSKCAHCGQDVGLKL